MGISRRKLLSLPAVALVGQSASIHANGKLSQEQIDKFAERLILHVRNELAMITVKPGDTIRIIYDMRVV